MESWLIPKVLPKYSITTLAMGQGCLVMFGFVNHLFITGGTGGLGRAIQAEFNAPDWRISAPTREILGFQNVADFKLSSPTLPVSLLICAAGLARDVPLIRARESDWEEVYSINYQFAAACAEVLLPRMIEQGRGHIIFISSFSAFHPPIGQVAYATAKAALLGLTTDLATAHGRSGIRVNAISPGFLETRMTENVSIQRKKEVLANHALGRFNTPRSVAKFIRFLHENLTETSGQVFQLDSRII